MPSQQELKQQGNIHFQNDDFEKAIEFYTLAIEQDAFCDEAAPILSNRSLCYYNIGKYKEAYEDAGCCCGIRPDWAKGFARRGAAAEELKEWQIALESYEEYLKLDKSDEMEIATKTNRVKKFVDAIEKKKQQREKELQGIDEELMKLKDLQFTTPTKEEALAKKKMRLTDGSRADKKKCKVYKLLSAGCEEMDIDKIELAVKHAVKHGADLGEYFMVNGAMEKTLRGEVPSSANFSHYRFEAVNFALSRLCAEEDPLCHSITSGAKEALNFLLRKSHRSKMSEFEQTDLLIRQRNYFDRLLDLPNHQREKYVPPPQVTRAMCEICTYDSDNPIRDDLVMILLEKGKKYFVGDDVSEKEFKKIVLRCLLMGGTHMVGTNGAPKAIDNTSTFQAMKILVNLSSPSDSSSLRKLLQCIQICLQGLTPEDLNSDCDSRIICNLPTLAQLFPINMALIFHKSSDVAELLLDHGAAADAASQTANVNCTSDSRIASMLALPPLLVASKSSTRIADRLLSRGAKFPREKLPDWVHAQFEEKDAETMMVPQNSEDYCPWILQILEGMDLGVDSDDQVSQEGKRVRWLFDTLANQNLSVFLPPTKTERFHTPLTYSIFRKLPLGILESIIKARPKIVFTPSLMKDGKNFPLGTLFNTLGIGSISSDYAKTVLKLLLDHGLDFSTSPAFHINGQNPWSVADFIEGYPNEANVKPECIKTLEALYKYGLEYEAQKNGKVVVA